MTLNVLYFVIACISLVLVFLLLWKKAYDNQGVVFAICATIIGLMFILTSPRYVGVVWDDEVHYIRTLSLCSLVDDNKYAADGKMINEYDKAIFELQKHRIFSKDLNSNRTFVTNELYKNKVQVTKDTDYELRFGLFSIAYIPYAFFIILGRLMKLSHEYVFVFGKLGSLVTYITVMYFAIKRLRYGRTLLTVFALLPTTLCMAFNYSSDYWVIAWITLGFSIFISELQNPEKKMENKTIVLLLGSFFLGCLPKAIYFVLILPLLFMPGNKFVNKKQRVIYCVAVIGTAVALIMTVALPILLRGFSQGDSRGGSEVNSPNQVRYIVNNPIPFALLLFENVIKYLNPYDNLGYTTDMSYLGEGRFSGIVLYAMCVLTFVDRDSEKHKMSWIRVATIAGSIITVLLIFVAMYIDYNAVGSLTISGCQKRYMLPMLFPLLYFIGIDGIKVEFNKNGMSTICMVLIIAVFMYNYGKLYLFV